MQHANTLTGADAYCFKAFAEALEIIPYTLAENAGLNPIGKYFVFAHLYFNTSLHLNSIYHVERFDTANDFHIVINFEALIFNINL